MKIIDRYLVRSVLKTSLATLFICALLLIAVELFSQMNEIMNNLVPLSSLVALSVLALPEYLMMVAAISFLFGVTFTLSQLQANNEMIMLYNSGFSYARVVSPIIICSIVVTLVFFVFSESVSIRATVGHDMLSEELFGRSSTTDNRNITMRDIDGNTLIYASRYDDESHRLYNVLIAETDEEGNIIRRLSAARGDYDEYKGYWIFSDAILYLVSDGLASGKVLSQYEYETFNIEPRLFRNVSGRISTMDYQVAIDYLERMKHLDIEVWQSGATEFYQRLLAPFAILILVIISCSTSYQFKRNVFLFSVIQSLCIAVVYYVAVMVATIMGQQGVLSPLASVIFPLVVIILLTVAMRLLGRRNA